MKHRFPLTVVACILMMCIYAAPALVFAQTAETTVPMPAFDWNAFFVQLIQAVTIPMTFFAVWAAKFVAPKLPKGSIPMIAMGLGILLDFGVSHFTGAGTNPVRGALMGFGATWLREFIDNLTTNGSQPVGFKL